MSSVDGGVDGQEHGPGWGDPSFREGDRVWRSTGDGVADREAYRIERIGPEPDRLGAVVTLEGEDVDEQRTLTVGEVQTLLRHADWGLEYVPQEGDRLRHECFHLPGEIGQTYEITSIYEHERLNQDVARLECVSDRRYKDFGLRPGRIASSVNNCSRRYGRGDQQRLEPVRDVEE